jgi:hypothetical protein
MRSLVFSFLHFLRRRRTAGRRSAGRAAVARRQPRLEGLEERNLLTAPPLLPHALSMDQVQIRFDPNNQTAIQISVTGYGTVADLRFAPGMLESLSVSVPLPRTDASAGSAVLSIIVDDFDQTGVPGVTVCSGANTRVAVGLPTGTFLTLFQQSAPNPVTPSGPPVNTGNAGTRAPLGSGPGPVNQTPADQPAAGVSPTPVTDSTTPATASPAGPASAATGQAAAGILPGDQSPLSGAVTSAVANSPDLHRQTVAPQGPQPPAASQSPVEDKGPAAGAPDTPFRAPTDEGNTAGVGVEPAAPREADSVPGVGETSVTGPSTSVPGAFLDGTEGRGVVAVAFYRPAAVSGFWDEPGAETGAAGNFERPSDVLAVLASPGWPAPALAAPEAPVRDGAPSALQDTGLLRSALLQPLLLPARLDGVEDWGSDAARTPDAAAPPAVLLPETARRGDAGDPESAPRQGGHADPSPWVPLGGLLAQVFYLGGLKQADAAPEAEAAVEGLQAPGDVRLVVADLIQRSTEVFTQLIQSFYALFLGREAAAGEEQGWVGMLLAGRTQEDVLGAFLSTREFYDRATVLVHSGTPDERYVQALHQVLLHRSALPQEVSGYLAALSGTVGGAGRAVLPSLLVRSVEYRTQQIEALYRTLLARQDAGALRAAEIAAWACSPFDLLTIRTFLVGRLSGVSKAPSAD